MDRRITLRLYPSGAQHAKLGGIRARLAELYNAALEERRDAWKKSKTSISFKDQCRSLTLNIENMTSSASGTQDAPGKNVAQKSGLNREILDTAPGLLTRQLRAKAEEAGCAFVVVNTRLHKPSQTCPQCDAVVKKTLNERQHRCGCGFKATRDQAAALVILMRALEGYGRKPAGGDAPENSIQNGEAVWVE